MESLRRKTLTRNSTVAAGIAAALIVGTIFPSAAKGVPAAGYGSNSAVRAAAVSASASDETVEFIEYRKAGIDEYELPAAVTAVLDTEEPADEEQTEDAKENNEKTAKKESISADSLLGDSDEPYVYRSDFSVSLPGDGTKVYDPKPEKLNYTKTRSIAKEYYTVKDLISGGTITMNAYDLVCGMVYNEIGDGWKEEAIKAQAVAAYSILRFNDALGFTPTVAVKRNFTAKIKKCVSAVEGQCVYYNGGIANAVYGASTAGYSCDSAKVFGISYGYLKPVVGEYDAQDPNYGKTAKFAESYIRNKLQARLGIKLSSNVSNWFKVGSVFSGKYVDSLIIDGGKAKMTGQAARTLFGLKSAAFEISYSNGFFYFKTYGYGHGVGMSQWGAKLYADHGYSYDQILRHYFVNTAIKVSDASAKALKRGGVSAQEIQKIVKETAVAGPESGSAASNPVEISVTREESVVTPDPEPAVTEAPKTEPEPAEPEEPAVTTTTAPPAEQPPEEVPAEEETEVPEE